MPNTIVLRGDQFTSREDRCNEAITPGHLCNYAANDRLQKHATSGGGGGKLFALEADYVGNGVTVAYASGDRVPYADCTGGIVVWAFLASGQNVARGARLMSAGDGTLTAQTGTNIDMAQADEDADATVANTTTAGIRFRARVV